MTRDRSVSEKRQKRGAQRGRFEITETYMTGLRVMKMIAARLSFVAATIIK